MLVIKYKIVFLKNVIQTVLDINVPMILQKLDKIVGKLFGEAIRRVTNEESVSNLFK